MVAWSASMSPRTKDQLRAPGVGVANRYVVTDAPVGFGVSTLGRWLRYVFPRLDPYVWPGPVAGPCQVEAPLITVVCREVDV